MATAAAPCGDLGKGEKQGAGVIRAPRAQDTEDADVIRARRSQDMEDAGVIRAR